ncbi:hypothetical protein BVG16_19925 [Paenibacillus selenitireducens]|uniref:Uncharacterized protein n=2 Tax=Paenibacillus selenitireducens TaxID=1324314 RepID=A0A1T2X6U6_9BACL|nr:hypothetical protein BVG16_19925 [Paenibacillus selenitireducens]
MAGMWFITIYFRTAIYFYASVIGLTQIFNLKDHRSIIMPLGIIMIVFSLIIHPNVLHSSQYNREAWLPYGSMYGLLLPLILLGAQAIRKKIKINEKAR